jgi:hypothetical protein
MRMLIHVVEKRERGGKNEDMQRAEQAKQKNNFPLWWSRSSGR